MIDPIVQDENRYQFEKTRREWEWERMQDYANKIEQDCLSNAASLHEAVHEEGDEALASVLLLAISNPTPYKWACVTIAVGDCVRRYADGLARRKFEDGDFSED